VRPLLTPVESGTRKNFKKVTLTPYTLTIQSPHGMEKTSFRPHRVVIGSVWHDLSLV